jgi:hypothetical protein
VYNAAKQMKMAAFCVVAPCSLVEVYRRFRGTCCLHHQVIALMMEAASTSEMSVNFYRTAQRYNPEVIFTLAAMRTSNPTQQNRCLRINAS